MAGHSIPPAGEFATRCGVHGSAGTAALAEKAAGLLRGGEIILLYGKLGAGKTCFTQGLCRGLGIDRGVVSPTFTLVNSYTGRLLVHHLDFFRIEPGCDLDDIGVPDILDQVWDGAAVLVAEWPDPLLAELGPDAVRLELLATGGAGADDRIWHLRGVPSVPAPWAELFSDGGSGPDQEDDSC